MNEQNLIQNSSRSLAEKKALSRKGQAKGAQTKRERKKMKQTMQMLLNLQVPESEAKQKMLEVGIAEEDANLQSAILYKQVSKALNGDTDSAKFCRDTAGEFIGAEEEKQEKVKQIIKIPASDMSSAFIDLNRDIDNRGHLEYWIDGGRASLKSSFVGEKIPELLENNPNMCALCIRRVSNTLKDSVYAQIQWGIDKLSETYSGLIDDYSFKTSPMEITKKSTGQKIYFRGTDDPGKIKSIKPPKGMYIGIIWYEEFDQIQGMNAVRKINQSVIRGGNDFIEFYTFNTPASRMYPIFENNSSISRLKYPFSAVNKLGTFSITKY